MNVQTEHMTVLKCAPTPMDHSPVVVMMDSFWMRMGKLVMVSCAFI